MIRSTRPQTGERRLAEKNEDNGLYSDRRQMLFCSWRRVANGAANPRVDALWMEVGDFDFSDKHFYGSPAVVDQNGIGSCVGAGCNVGGRVKGSV